MVKGKSEIKGVNLFLLIYVIYYVFVSIAFVTVIPAQISGFMSMLFSGVLLSVLPAFVYFAVTRRKIRDVVPLSSLDVKNIALIVAMAIFMQPLLMFISLLSGLAAGNAAADMIETLVDGGANWIFGLAVIAVLPAIFEETLFRGVFLSGYKRAPFAVAAIFSGMAFAMAHMNLSQFFYAGVMGVIMAYLVNSTKSIFSSMIFHFAVNGIQWSLAYVSLKFAELVDETSLSEAAENENLAGTIIVFAVFSLFSTAIFWLFFRIFRKRNNVENEEKGDFNFKELIDIRFILAFLVFIVVSITFLK